MKFESKDTFYFVEWVVRVGVELCDYKLGTVRNRMHINSFPVKRNSWKRSLHARTWFEDG